MFAHRPLSSKRCVKRVPEGPCCVHVAHVCEHFLGWLYPPHFTSPNADNRVLRPVLYLWPSVPVPVPVLARISPYQFVPGPSSVPFRSVPAPATLVPACAGPVPRRSFRASPTGPARHRPQSHPLLVWMFCSDPGTCTENPVDTTCIAAVRLYF